ncbi:hypothetical protein LIER_37672 [Lithospermum erythrorhizon]|uniref:Uncharacterized protein n=1 Tax=Lithospermum erythrorhizon TaxID=34254 RepID=A0AAV3PNY8_LITER
MNIDHEISEKEAPRAIDDVEASDVGHQKNVNKKNVTITQTEAENDRTVTRNLNVEFEELSHEILLEFVELHPTLLEADPKPLLLISPPSKVVALSDEEEPYKEVWGWDEYEDK